MNTLKTWFSGLAVASVALMVVSSLGCGGTDTKTATGLECGDDTAEKDGICVAKDATMKCGDGTVEKDGSCIAKDGGDGLKCGDGTTDKNGVCTPDSATGLACGKGTKEVDGNCVADVSNPGGLACGAGTKEKDGKCIADVADGLKCGTGTVEKDGECVSDGKSTGTVACGQGTVEENGECVLAKQVVQGYDVVGFGLVMPKLGDALINYPATAKASIVADTPFNAHLQVTMTNYIDGMAADDIYSCFLGAFQLQHPGGGASVDVSEKVTIPAACLYGEAGKGDPAATTMMYPVLSFSQTGDIMPANIDKASIRLDKGVPIKNAPGIDIELTAAHSDSSVIVLQTVPDSVVKTSSGDLIYGAPEINMDLEVTAYGANVVDENDEPLNILEDEDMEVSYAIKPSDEGVQDWQPIFLHEEGDPAKAVDEVEINNLAYALETNVIAQAPHYLAHGLYIEDDCGTKCSSDLCADKSACPSGLDGYCKLDAAKDECSADAMARSWIVDGAWKDYDKFTIRACLTSKSEHATAADNNCQYDEILIIRVDNKEDNEGDAGAGDLATVPKATAWWNKKWSNSIGGSALKLVIETSSETSVRKWTPAFGTDNWAKARVTSKYIGNREIVKGWMKGHISADKGWGYDYGISKFGKKIWGSKDGNSKGLNWSKKISYTKEWSAKKGWSFTFWVTIVPVNVSFGFQGKAKFAIGLDLKGGMLSEQNNVSPYLSASPWVKPGAILSAYASAGINLLIAKGGITVNVVLFKGDFPFSFTASVTQSGKLYVKVKVSVKLSIAINTLSGNLKLWVKLLSFSCKNWKPWSCSFGYKTIYSKNLFSFSGYTWKYDIYKSSIYDKKLKK